MEYNGYKFIDTIMLVCKEKRKTEVDQDYLQAYLVDPSNKKQLESARHWAEYVEFGNYDYDAREYDWKIEHKPIEFTFENNGFDFELFNCAGGSSQGGKLSFWNCIVVKDGKRFMIGINSDMLLQVLKEGSFTCGKCDNKVCFATKNGNCGVVIEDGETYKLAKKDMELKSNISKSLTTKYKPGDNVITATINDVYLGKFYRYYTWEDNYNHYRFGYTSRTDFRDCTLIKHKKPIPVYLFTTRNNKYSKSISKLSDLCRDDVNYYINIVDKLPRRSIGLNPLEIDISDKEFSSKIFDQHNQFNAEEETKKYSYAYTDMQLAEMFASRRGFGIAAEPFELSEEMRELFKKNNVKIIEE